jgi:hypothetical protein
VNKDDTALARAFVEAVVGLLPGGAHATTLVGIATERLLASRGPAAQFADVLHSKAQSISKGLLAAEREGLLNPGSGHAAVIDLTGILERVSITAEMLVDMGLDVDRLYAYLLQVAEPNLREASQGRRGRLEAALREIAEAVLALAPELPSVRLAFMRQMLRPRVPPAAV